MMFNEFFLSKNFSYEPLHYLEDSYMSIIALVCTLELYRSKLFITEHIEGILMAT